VAPLLDLSQRTPYRSILRSRRVKQLTTRAAHDGKHVEDFASPSCQTRGQASHGVMVVHAQHNHLVTR
jgi:hypothetical protein